MSIAFACVLVAGLLPYLATVIAKAGAKFDNRTPRDWLAQQAGYRRRANAAQANGFETFPLFAAAVIIAAVRQLPQHHVDLLAMGFIAARVLYLAFYLADRAALRSLAWVAGLACVIGIFAG
jgi:uncharacterized MAPEG superfamily protein